MLSDRMLTLLEGRGLDVEKLAERGFASEMRRWPVEDERGTTFHNVEALLIPFFRRGELVRRKWKRTQELAGATAYLQEKGGLRIAYNEDCLRDDTLIGQALLVTEGELDAETAIQCGLLRTISVPDGAPKDALADSRSETDLRESKKYDWFLDIEPLVKVDRVAEVILAVDGDTAGAALMQDLSILFGRARCKFLTYPLSKADRGRERCKDLNEVLQDYGQKGVIATIANAKWIAVEGLYSMSEMAEPPERTVWPLKRHTLFADNCKIRSGDFSVWTGTPGSGKSTLLNDLLCSIVVDYGVNVCWASFEQDPKSDHRRALRSWFCKAHPWEMYAEERALADEWIEERHSFIKPPEDRDASLDWVIDLMELAATRRRAKLFVIDPWNEVEHSRNPGETETEYTGRAIRLMKRFAKSFDVHVAVVAHPAKLTRGADGKMPSPGLYDISGSAMWYNKADLGVVVHRDSEDETHVRTQKSRYHDAIGKPGTVAMAYNSQDRAFVELRRVA